MFQNWIKILLLKCVGSALKCSETQVLAIWKLLKLKDMLVLQKRDVLGIAIF